VKQVGKATLVGREDLARFNQRFDPVSIFSIRELLSQPVNTRPETNVNSRDGRKSDSLNDLGPRHCATVLRNKLPVRICSWFELLCSDSRRVDKWMKQDVHRLKCARVVFQYADVRWRCYGESIWFREDSFGHVGEVLRTSR